MSWRIALAAAVAGLAARAEEAAPTPAGATPTTAATPAPVSARSTAELPPVAGRAYGAPASLPPVSGQLFHLAGKLEVQPLLLVSVGDPFWRTVAAGVRGELHFDERWSLSAHVAGGLSLLSAPIEVCGSGTCGDPAADRLRSAPGKLQFLLGTQVGWAPIYGKLSLLGERTLHFDAYLSAGPELILQRIAQDAASPERAVWAPGARFSIGERLFLSDRFMIRLAASELVWPGRVRGRAEIQRKLTIEAGVAWLFGSTR